MIAVLLLNWTRTLLCERLEAGAARRFDVPRLETAVNARL
jgi:hypothetical protein